MPRLTAAPPHLPGSAHHDPSHRRLPARGRRAGVRARAAAALAALAALLAATLPAAAQAPAPAAPAAPNAPAAAATPRPATLGGESGSADTVRELEQALPSLTGLARARALARLTDAHKLDDPERALALGAEALGLFALHPDTVAQVATLNEMGWAHMTRGRYDEAARHADAGRRLAEAAGHRLGQARALSNLGSLAQRRGDPERAVALFSEAVALQRAEGDERQIANTLNNLGFVHSTDLADYDRSLQYHLEALRIRERLGEPEATALSLNNIGHVYSRLRQYDRALDFLERALALRVRLGLKSRTASTHNNIGELLLERGDAARALEHLQAALALREQLGDRSNTATAHRALGVAHLALGRPDLARRHADASLRLGGEAGDHGLAVQNLILLSSVERAEGRGDAAEAAAQRALARAQANRLRDLARRAWEELAHAQEAAGRHAAALASHRRFKAVSDSIYDEASARRIASAERRHAEERRGSELARLRTAEALRRAEVERRTMQRNLTIVLALLAGLLGLIVVRRRSDRARLAEELSVTDMLTGARNRRYVQQTVGMDMAASLRRYRAAEERGTSVDDGDIVFLLIDLDHFKAVNDAFGHAAGDRLLAELAAVLRDVCRESDVVVRWGGEEFLVVSRFTDRAQAASHAARIREAVAAHVTRLDDGRTVRVTCSIGFAVFPFSLETPDALGWEALVSLADQGTYAAKRRGRDTWVGYHGEGEPPAGVLHATPGMIEQWVAEGRLVRETPAGVGEVAGVAGVA